MTRGFSATIPVTYNEENVKQSTYSGDGVHNHMWPADFEILSLGFFDKSRKYVHIKGINPE